MKPMVFSESGRALRTEEAVKPNSFQNVLSSAIAALEETQAASRLDAYQLAFGNTDDLSQIMINTMKAESMIQTTVQITTRMIGAYKEIMNMQI